MAKAIGKFLVVVGVLAFIAVSSVSGAYAADAQQAAMQKAFSKHFKVVKDDKGVVQFVMLTKGLEGFSIHPVIEEIKDDLRALRMSKGSSKEMLIEGLGADEFAVMPAFTQAMTLKGLDELRAFDADVELDTPEFHALTKTVTKKLKEHLMGYRVIAHATDPLFFHYRKVGVKALDFAIEIAKLKGGDPRQLAIVKFMIDGAVKMLEERRSFYQNMLLHYLEQGELQTLEMAEGDVAKLKSSVYASRLTWSSVFEARTARKNWDRYGTVKFRTVVAGANKMLAKNRAKFASVSDRINFAFQIANYGDQKVIVDLINPKFMFSGRPSIAYIYENPWKVERQRRLLRINQIAMRVASPMMMGISDAFIYSMYLPQSILEGALAAHFESTGNGNGLKTVVAQSLNPFLRFDFASE